jgi:hypothetical protein
MQRLFALVSYLLGAYYFLAGLSSALIACCWEAIARANVAIRSELTPGHFLLNGIWYIFTGVCVLVGMFLTTRKAHSNWRLLLALGAASGAFLTMRTLSAWLYLRRTFDLVELLLTIPALSLLILRIRSRIRAIP